MCEQGQGLEARLLVQKWPDRGLDGLPPPDKLFGKRLLQAGRYLVSHKAWMKTVPTENCDVLMTFPGTRAHPHGAHTGLPESGSPEWESVSDLRPILARLLSPCNPWQIRRMTTRCCGC